MRKLRWLPKLRHRATCANRSMLQLVCASANPDKVAEIQQLLAGVVDLLPRPADVLDVVEDADTLVGNARLKAEAIVAATGLPAVADDTGLFVDALDGRPGVFTARYAGEGCSYADNRAKMIDELSGRVQRGARFVTAAMVVWPDGTELAVEGVCPGQITTTERGDVGFGYDAIFAPDEADGLTFAEMAPAAKHAVSHRGRAFEALLTALERR
jgi:XTP/dITP diphosphohydrolase